MFEARSPGVGLAQYGAHQSFGVHGKARAGLTLPGREEMGDSSRMSLGETEAGRRLPIVATGEALL